jgi:hypothetical protein
MGIAVASLQTDEKEFSAYGWKVKQHLFMDTVRIWGYVITVL